MEFLPEEIQQYAELHAPAENELLAELNRNTHLKVMYPRMLCGHFQGRLLSFFAKMVAPELIVEIGTYTGYSALCFAEGLAPNGKLITLEIDPETAFFAQQYFDRSIYKDKIDLRVGPALEMLDAIPGPIDMVLLDANKEQYLDYYKAVMPKVRSGGLIIADNVLWSGNVVDKSITDTTTETIRSFNTFVREDSAVEAILLPVRDGLYLIRKK
jgi:caffeoyl-CoA O-methyltransferase